MPSSTNQLQKMSERGQAQAVEKLTPARAMMRDGSTSLHARYRLFDGPQLENLNGSLSVVSEGSNPLKSAVPGLD